AVDATNAGGMICGSASNDEDLGRCVNLLGELVVVELLGSQSVPQRLGLLMNLFEHEVFEALFLGGFRIPCDRYRVPLDRSGIFQLKNPSSIRVENGHFSLVKKNGPPCEWKESCKV